MRNAMKNNNLQSQQPKAVEIYFCKNDFGNFFETLAENVLIVHAYAYC